MSPRSSMWSIVEFRGREGLVRLEDDWRRLYAAMPQRTGFHAYEAHLAYVDHVMPLPDQLRCLALRDDRQVRAICLLEAGVDRTLGAPLRVWRVPVPPHHVLGDIICPEDDARQAFAPALVAHLRRQHRGRRVLVLGPLPEGSNLWDGLRQLAWGEYCVNPSTSSFVVDCERPFDELVSGLSTSFRNKLRLCRRRLASLADVRFESVTGESDLGPALATFLEVEASGWKGASGTRTAVRFRANQPAFFRSLLTLHGNEDYCEINALYAEGRCIASQVCVRTGGEYAYLKSGYDESYSRLAPGKLLLERTVERCCEDPGISRLNFVSHEVWFSDWHPGSIALQQAYMALGPWSGRPRIGLLRFRFGPARRIVRWLRAERERFGRQKAEASLRPSPRRSGRDSGGA